MAEQLCPIWVATRTECPRLPATHAVADTKDIGQTAVGDRRSIAAEACHRQCKSYAPAWLEHNSKHPANAQTFHPGAGVHCKTGMQPDVYTGTLWHIDALVVHASV